MEQTGISVDELVRLGEGLRPRYDARIAPVIEIAKKLGIETWIYGTPNSKLNPVGRICLTKPPQIQVVRQAPSEFLRRLEPCDDELLRARERFTIAHEIGHWLAHVRFGISGQQQTRSQYWRDEQIINRFAGRLLVPDWQLDQLLRSHPPDVDIFVTRLIEWSRECSVSPEVVAKRICEVRPGVGFLKLTMQADRYFPVFIVRDDASGSGLQLPRLHKVIRSESLASALTRSKIGNQKFIAFRFDPRQLKSQNIFCSWKLHAGYADDYEIDDPHSKGHSLDSQIYWTSWGLVGFDPKTKMTKLC